MIPPSRRNLRARRARRVLRRRRYRRRRRANPLFSSKPQTLGYGSANTLCNIRYEFMENDAEVHTVNLANLVLNQPEFLLKKQLYQYMKIQWVRLVFFAHNYTSSTANLYIQLQYNLNPDTTNLLIDDQSKVIGPFQTKQKSFTFRPPNITIANFQGTVYNFKEWLPSHVGVVNMPITLIYQKVDALAFRFTCEVQIKVLFRGGNVTTVENMGNLLRACKTVIERDNKKYKEDMEEDEKQEKQIKKQEKIEEKYEENIGKHNENYKENIEEFKEKIEESIEEDIGKDEEEEEGNYKEIMKKNKEENKKILEEIIEKMNNMKI